MKPLHKKSGSKTSFSPSDLPADSVQSIYSLYSYFIPDFYSATANTHTKSTVHYIIKDESYHQTLCNILDNFCEFLTPWTSAKKYYEFNRYSRFWFVFLFLCICFTGEGNSKGLLLYLVNIFWRLNHNRLSLQQDQRSEIIDWHNLSALLTSLMPFPSQLRNVFFQCFYPSCVIGPIFGIHRVVDLFLSIFDCHWLILRMLLLHRHGQF